MRKVALAVAAVLSLAAAKKTAPPVPTTPVDVQRGKLLVTAGSCSDCHTPMKMDEKLGMPVPDMSRFLSGHPEGAPGPASTLTGNDQAVIGPTFTSFRLPFGVVYTANLTPDKQWGLGSWTENMFVKAMRTGHHMGVDSGRPILPPMPWTSLAQLPDSDLHAIWAFLQTVKPISNHVPEPSVPQPVLEKLSKAYEAMNRG